RRRDVIAAFKALGATGRDVFTIYATQVIVLAAIGSVIGLAAGAALPFVIVGLFGKILPLPVVPALHPDELALSFVYGLLTARPHHHAAAGDRKHLPAGRADTVGGAVARPGARRPRHHHPDRRQSAPAVSGRAAGSRAVILLHRYSELGSRPLRRVPETDRAGLDGRGRSDAA